MHWLVGGLILFMTLTELWLGLSIYCVSVAGVICFGLYIFTATAMYVPLLLCMCAETVCMTVGFVSVCVVCYELGVCVCVCVLISDRFLSFDLMRWLAPWGDYLRIHDKNAVAPKVVIAIVQSIAALIVVITIIVVCVQIWLKDANVNDGSFYSACVIGELSGGLHWAWYLGFGGGAWSVLCVWFSVVYAYVVSCTCV